MSYIEKQLVGAGNFQDLLASQEAFKSMYSRVDSMKDELLAIMPLPLKHLVDAPEQSTSVSQPWPPHRIRGARMCGAKELGHLLPTRLPNTRLPL